MLDSIVKIGPWAFLYQTKLTSITFKEGLKELEECAFFDCGSFAKVEIPSTLTTLYSNVFYYAFALSEIVINKPKDSISGASWQCAFGEKAIFWAG